MDVAQDEGGKRKDAQRATYPFVSVSTAMASAGAKALTFRSKEVLSTTGEVITAIGP